MKTLECGCEQHQDTGTFMSLCFDHGQHMLMRKGASKHPRFDDMDIASGYAEKVQTMERKLVLRIAPVILSKWSTVTDPMTTAECIFQHVKEIMRRME